MLRHRFYKTQLFKKRATELNAWSDVDKLTLALDENPEAGDLIPGGDGLRKVRITLAAQGVGKRGGARVIYYFVLNERWVIYLFIYAKNEKQDVTGAELKLVRELRDQAVKQHKEQAHAQELRKGITGRARRNAHRKISD